VCFRVICCWSHCVFFTILLSSTIQTLARRHHLPSDHATNRVYVASLFFSPSITLKKTETKKKIAISRFITAQTESTPLPYFSPSVTSKKRKKDQHLPFDHAINRVNAASLFFSFGYIKKQKQKKKTKEKGYKAVVSSQSF
jgi:hypothetical protein